MWIIFGCVLEQLSPIVEVVHHFRSISLLIEDGKVIALARLRLCRYLCACFCGWNGRGGRLVVLCARLVDGMALVVAGLRLAIVRKIAVLTCSEIGVTAHASRDGIASARVLVVAVGIVVIYILQCRPVVLVVRVVTIAGTEIILVEVVGYLAIPEVIFRIVGVLAAVHSIHDGAEA